MTNWEGVPLRPQGQNWPGLNTRGGRLSRGVGQLEDGSINQIINEGDTLEKRKGIVRGLNERFDGVVCGLFKYTDDCGIEWLLVADEAGIFIRQPFVIPTFTQSDAYPFDSFSEAAVDSENWRNTSRYETVDDELVEVFGVSPITGVRVPDANVMRWFKEATNKSYQTRIEYRFEDQPAEQHKTIVMKGTGDLSAGAFLQGELVFDNRGTYSINIYHRDSTGTTTSILNRDLVGQPSGFFTLKYVRDEGANAFVASVEVFPTGGTPVIAAAPTFNTIQDADFGQVTGIGIGHKNGAQQFDGILVVDGGPV